MILSTSTDARVCILFTHASAISAISQSCISPSLSSVATMSSMELTDAQGLGIEGFEPAESLVAALEGPQENSSIAQAQGPEANWAASSAAVFPPANPKQQDIVQVSDREPIAGLANKQKAAAEIGRGEQQAIANYAAAKNLPVAEVGLQMVQDDPQGIYFWATQAGDWGSRSPHGQAFKRAIKWCPQSQAIYGSLDDPLAREFRVKWSLAEDYD
jgi:hypothetical protein